MRSFRDRSERRVDYYSVRNSNQRSSRSSSSNNRTQSAKEQQEQQRMKLEEQKQKMERQTQKAEQATEVRQGDNSYRAEHQTQQQRQQRQTRKMEQFQVGEEQTHHRELEWTEPPLPPPPPQRTTSQQQPPRAAAVGHEATPPLPPPPEQPEQLDSRVEQWVRQTSMERLVSTAASATAGAAEGKDKDLEKLALDIAESVVENMERGGSSSSKAQKEEYQEVRSTGWAISSHIWVGLALIYDDPPSCIAAQPILQISHKPMHAEPGRGWNSQNQSTQP